MADKKYAWEPNTYFKNESRIARFMQRYGISSWRKLKEYSDNIDWFWPKALDFLGVEWFTPYAELYDNSQGMSHTKWFIRGKINIYENCITKNIRRGLGDKTCIFYEHESGGTKEATFSEFKKLIDAIAASMKAHGVTKGDFVGMCMPISIESAAVMFACFKIGAICIQMAPTTTKSGVEDILGHLRITKAKMLFLADSYIYKGKEYDLNDTYYDTRDIPSLEYIVVLGNRTGHQYFSPFLIEEYGKGEREILWEDFIKKGKGKTAHTVRCNAEDLALMLFSSGTTNIPKRILHTHGGLLAQICKEIGFAFDCKESDVFYWMTNFGWMMAPWEIIGALHFGASLVFFEGVPMHPRAERVFEIIQKYKVTILGSTPGHIAGLRKDNITPDGYDLSSIRVLGSTGAILHPENWMWYFDHLGGKRCPIINISGGTEICGSIVSPLPVMPQRPGTVGTSGLAMGTDVVDVWCNSVTGQVGRFVCRNPFPSMTKSFFGNEDGYQKTYFSDFPGVWTHPDFGEIDEDGLMFVRGRSDDVVIKNGIKFSPAKIEEALVQYEDGASIMEASAVAVPYKTDAAIICFIVVKANKKLDAEALRAHVASRYHPQAKPDKVYVVKELPKNAAAKVPYSALRKAFYGEGTSDIKIINPESLEAIKAYGKEFFSADNT